MIIPVQTQYYAMKGLTNLVKVINTIRVKLNPGLKVLGLLPTFYDGRTLLARDMLDELKVVGDHHVFETVVRNTVKLGEAPLTGQPITTYVNMISGPRKPGEKDGPQEVHLILLDNGRTQAYADLELRATLQARYGQKVMLPVIGPRRSLMARLGLGSSLERLGPETLAAIEERQHWQRFGL